MGSNLTVNYVDGAAVILFGIGFTMLLLHRNLLNKIIGLNIMDTGIYLLLAAKGFIAGRKPPIVINGKPSMEEYINPVPGGLVLTGIVVSVSLTAILLGLTIRIYQNYHTLDMDEIAQICKKEGD